MSPLQPWAFTAMPPQVTFAPSFLAINYADSFISYLVQVQLLLQALARYNSQQPSRAWQGGPEALHRRPGHPPMRLFACSYFLNPVQFSECATVFRSVLQQLLLVVADEPGDAEACKELLAQSRDYLVAVRYPFPL